MAKKSQGGHGQTVGPVQNYPFEKFPYDDAAMASEHEDWETYTTPMMAAVIDQPHEEVGEVHEDDEFYGTPKASNTKEDGIVH